MRNQNLTRAAMPQFTHFKSKVEQKLSNSKGLEIQISSECNGQKDGGRRLRIEQNSQKYLSWS